MSYILNDTQKNIKDMVAQFAQRDIIPNVEELEKENTYPQEVINKIAGLQLTSLLLPADAGGPGLDTLSYCLILEELSKAHASVGMALEAHNSLALFPLSQLGTDEQKAAHLEPLRTGQAFGTAAIVEEGAGYNWKAFNTKAEGSAEQGWKLNGEKTMVVNGAVAQKMIVAAKTDKGLGLFIIDREKASSIEPVYVLGTRCAGMSTIRFDGVDLPGEALLGDPAEIAEVWNKTLSLHTMGVGVIAVGIGQACLEASVEYANTRVQFNQTIAHFPAIQWMIADMGINVEASRLLAHKTAALYDAGQDISRAASLAKFNSAETTMDTAVKCVQVHGGVGYTKEFTAERFMRDAKVVQVLGVPSETHRDALSRDLLGI